MKDYEIFELGNAVLSRGATLRGAKLAYKTFGTLNAKKDNAIVYPTWYSAQHYDNEWLIGEGMALDPRKFSSSSRTCSATGCRRRRATRRSRTTGRASRRSRSTTRCACSTGSSPRNSASRSWRW